MYAVFLGGIHSASIQGQHVASGPACFTISFFLPYRALCLHDHENAELLEFGEVKGDDIKVRLRFGPGSWHEVQAMCRSQDGRQTNTLWQSCSAIVSDTMLKYRDLCEGLL